MQSGRHASHRVFWVAEGIGVTQEQEHTDIIIIYIACGITENSASAKETHKMKKALTITAVAVCAVVAGVLLFSILGAAVFVLPLIGGAFAVK